LYGPLTD